MLFCVVAHQAKSALSHSVGNRAAKPILLSIESVGPVMPTERGQKRGQTPKEVITWVGVLKHGGGYDRWCRVEQKKRDDSGHLHEVCVAVIHRDERVRV